MNDNTILRIKVPAHLYESVKEQLTLNEAKKAKHHYGAGMEVIKEKKAKAPKEEKKKVEEAITGTEQDLEQLKDLYIRIKKMEEEGTDLESAIQYAVFDVTNPEAAKELSINEDVKPESDWTVGEEIIGGEKHYFLYNQETGKRKGMYKSKKEAEADINKSKVEEAVNEAVNPNLIAGIIGLLFSSLPLLYTIIKNYRSAKTAEEKEAVLQQAANTIGSKMSGNMEEAKDELNKATFKHRQLEKKLESVVKEMINMDYSIDDVIDLVKKTFEFESGPVE